MKENKHLLRRDRQMQAGVWLVRADTQGWKLPWEPNWCRRTQSLCGSLHHGETPAFISVHSRSMAGVSASINENPPTVLLARNFYISWSMLFFVTSPDVKRN